MEFTSLRDCIDFDMDMNSNKNINNENNDKDLQPGQEASLDSVYRKSNTNNSLYLYLIKRELWESISPSVISGPGESGDPQPSYKSVLEGAVTIHPEVLSTNQKVFVELIAFYTYNKSELGQFDLNVKRYIYRFTIQLFPQISRKVEYSSLITLLCSKIGENTYPFLFDLSETPNSLFIYDISTPNSKNGISWEVRAYIDTEPSAKPSTDDSVIMKIRKSSYILDSGPTNIQPSSKTIERNYANCCGGGGSVKLSAELNKLIYDVNEEIELTLKISNNSTKPIEKIKISFDQDIMLELLQINEYSVSIYSLVLDDASKNLPILPGTENWSTTVKFKIGTNETTDFYNILLEVPSGYTSDKLVVSESCVATSSLSSRINVKEIIDYNKAIEDTLTQPFCEHPVDVRYSLSVACEMPIIFGILGGGPKVKLDVMIIRQSSERK